MRHMVQSNCSRIAGHKGHNCLHEMSAPTISPQTWKIYILKLTGEYYYVGISPDPEARFLKHTEGTGALWTRLHRPIQVLETIETNIPLKNFFGAERVETKIAVALMKTYGWRKVRGGKFTQTVSYHVFGGQNFDMSLSIMDSKGKSNHFWSNLPGAGPCLNNPCFERIFTIDFSEQTLCNIWSFFG